MNTENPDRRQHEELRENLGALIELWEKTAAPEAGSLSLRVRDRNRRLETLRPARATILLALASHTVTLAGTVLELLDKNRVVEATPLIRSAYETALIAQWVFTVGNDASVALANEHGRNRRNLRSTAAEARSDVLQNIADQIAHADWDNLPSRSSFQAKSIKAMLDDLDGGTDLYAYYRFMCEYAHPSFVIMDQYLTADEDPQQLPTFRYIPDQPNPTPWLYFTVSSACLALFPVSTLLSDKSFRNRVREIARASQVGLGIRLSPEYYERQRKAREAEKAAAGDADRNAGASKRAK